MGDRHQRNLAVRALLLLCLRDGRMLHHLCALPAPLRAAPDASSRAILRPPRSDATGYSELIGVVNEGVARRRVANTQMNTESSRSHQVFSVVIESTDLQTQTVTKGKLSFVDLAGSERVKKSGATGEQLKEAQAINLSLAALGNVISALATDAPHVPYRDHKLTMLMSDSLGGSAKTLMFVNISPTVRAALHAAPRGSMRHASPDTDAALRAQDGNLDETQNSLAYGAFLMHAPLSCVCKS
jgi:hypothetical protein